MSRFLPLLFTLTSCLGGEGSPGMAAGQSVAYHPGDVPVPGVVCPDGVTIEGIDVSYYQGSIDWDQAAQAKGLELDHVTLPHGRNHIPDPSGPP